MTGQLRNRQTVGGAFRDISGRLARAGVDAPRLDARLLINAALAESGGGGTVLGQSARPLAASEERFLYDLADRREKREPMAQILGTREFWSLPFRVTADVLAPRADSETLVEAVLDRVSDKNTPLELLDLGTGSGCLLLALLSELPRASGIGVDISEAALAIGRQNAAALGLENRARFRHGDWCGGLEGPFDVILSNPPYVTVDDLAKLEPEVRIFEPRLALAGGKDGLDAYRDLIKGMCGLLATGGVVFLEIGLGQTAAVSGILCENGLQVIEIKEDLSGIPRVIEARRGAAPKAKKRLELRSGPD